MWISLWDTLYISGSKNVSIDQLGENADYAFCISSDSASLYRTPSHLSFHLDVTLSENFKTHTQNWFDSTKSDSVQKA